MLGTMIKGVHKVLEAPHRLFGRYGVPVRIETIVADQLRAAGIAPKHLGEFLTAHLRGRWSDQKAWDYRGDLANLQAAQPFDPSVQGRMQALASVLPPGTAAMPEFSLFATEISKYTETIRWVFYDHLVYPAAGTLDLLFFQNTPGAGRAVTNMFTAGQLPGNMAFLVTSIGINPKPSPTDTLSGVAATQWTSVMNTDSFYKFVISSKEYFTCAPVAFLPPGFGMGVQGFGTAALAASSNPQSGSPDKKAAYVFDIPLGILPTRTFSGEAQWGTLRAVTTVAVMENFIDGFLFRAVQ